MPRRHGGPKLRLPPGPHRREEVAMSEHGLKVGTADVRSAGPITFGPAGILFLADNASAWEMSSEGRWMKLRPKKGDRGRQAQQVFMRSARARARRRAASRSR